MIKHFSISQALLCVFVAQFVLSEGNDIHVKRGDIKYDAPQQSSSQSWTNTSITDAPTPSNGLSADLAHGTGYSDCTNATTTSTSSDDSKENSPDNVEKSADQVTETCMNFIPTAVYVTVTITSTARHIDPNSTYETVILPDPFCNMTTTPSPLPITEGFVPIPTFTRTATTIKTPVEPESRGSETPISFLPTGNRPTSNPRPRMTPPILSQPTTLNLLPTRTRLPTQPNQPTPRPSNPGSNNNNNNNNNNSPSTPTRGGSPGGTHAVVNNVPVTAGPRIAIIGPSTFNAAAPTPATYVVSGQTFTVLPSGTGVVVPGGMTVTPAPPAATMRGVEIGPGAGGGGVVLGGLSFELPGQGSTVVTVNGQAYTLVPGGVVHDGTTVEVLGAAENGEAPRFAGETVDGVGFDIGSETAVVDGHTVAIGEGATVTTLVVDGVTIVAGPDGLVFPSTTVEPLGSETTDESSSGTSGSEAEPTGNGEDDASAASSLEVPESLSALILNLFVAALVLM